MVAPTPKPTCGLCVFAGRRSADPIQGKPNAIVCNNEASDFYTEHLKSTGTCHHWRPFDVVQHGIWLSRKPISGTEAT